MKKTLLFKSTTHVLQNPEVIRKCWTRLGHTCFHGICASAIIHYNHPITSPVSSLWEHDDDSSTTEEVGAVMHRINVIGCLSEEYQVIMEPSELTEGKALKSSDWQEIDMVLRPLFSLRPFFHQITTILFALHHLNEPPTRLFLSVHLCTMHSALGNKIPNSWAKKVSKSGK